MTQQVRKGYRNHRKASWAAVLFVLAAAALAIVLPALGQSTTSATGVAPPSGNGIYPSIANVGGSNFACASAGMTYGGAPTPSGMRQFQISKPTPGPYTDPATGVTFNVTGATGSQDPKAFFSFSVSNNAAIVYHVGVNGGTNTAWYDYKNNAPANPAAATGGVFSDTNLHSTPDSKYTTSKPTFFTASITTFCFKPVVKIEGTVYRDADGDGTGDALLLTAHQVTATDGSSTTTSSTDTATGKYTLLVPSGGSYTVCMAPLSGEVQTKPGTTTECTSAAGYAFTSLTTNQTGRDFAFAGGVLASCNSSEPFVSQFNSGNATVVAKFSYYGATCKAEGKSFVFTTYVDGSGRTVKLSSVDALGAANCAEATGLGCQIVAQKVTWSLTGTSPELKTLSYDDTPYGTSGVMQFCKKDPIDRSPPSDGVTLLTGSGYFPADILPAGGQSSCLIKTTQGPGPNPKRVDEVYSAYDGKINLT